MLMKFSNLSLMYILKLKMKLMRNKISCHDVMGKSGIADQTWCDFLKELPLFAELREISTNVSGVTMWRSKGDRSSC
jgi:hypothetical protein